MRGVSQPRTGDQASRVGSPVNRIGSNTATGPRLARAAMVTVRVSGRVEVATTGPGASRIQGMTRCRPLPVRGGPTSRIESSTLHHSGFPLTRPTR